VPLENSRSNSRTFPARFASDCFFPGQHWKAAVSPHWFRHSYSYAPDPQSPIPVGPSGHCAVVLRRTRPDLVCLVLKCKGMVVRNISEAKAELSALIEAVQNGNEVIIAKAGKPVARLIAFRGPSRPRTPGSMAGEIWIAPDFDTLPDDIAEAFGIKEPRS
jgi:antitoxin (DNA-binding transcriptional repressor) of toxin-antitoxin stability system